MILLLQYTLIFASVLILVALGGCFAEHSGVINLGLEGIMIMGALGGALTMRYVPNTVPAIVMILAVILVSALVGMVYSCLLAVASINFKADQTLVGTALNLLGTAGATVIVKAINTAANPDDVSSIVQYGSAKNALLAPIGSFEFNWFMLVAFIALVTAYVTLYKTRFGLRLMACGEHPQAAASVGINVYKMRWAGVLISGVLGGIGGRRFGVAVRIRRGGLRLPVPRRYDLRPVEAAAHRAGRAAVRLLPCARQRLHGLQLPQGDEPAELSVQHAAVHHFAYRACLHVQEFPRAEGRGYPLRQRYALSCTRFLSPAGSYGLAGAFISSSGGFDFYANG